MLLIVRASPTKNKRREERGARGETMNDER
jgi:hypothetical protein